MKFLVYGSYSDETATFSLFLIVRTVLFFFSQALKVLNEMGTLLHFEVWSESLKNLYFLDPDWLAKMIAKVLVVSVKLSF
jgi:hypothetical protein